jgi:hypothetical protein
VEEENLQEEEDNFKNKFMVKLKFLKTVNYGGEVLYEKEKNYTLTNNEAFGFIERGIAVIDKGLEKPRRNKMITRKKERFNIKIK